MANKAFADCIRDSAGYVSPVPLEKWAAGVTEHGDIALCLAGRTSSASGNDEYCDQYVCSTDEAMNIASTIVRAVALADADAPAAPEPEKALAG